MTLTDIETQIFEESVDRWVLNAIASGVKTFGELITSLPGVYPSVVFSSFERLACVKKIPKNVTEDLIKPTKAQSEQPSSQKHQILLPVPHPLDYDWRFSDAAVEDLLSECKKLTSVNDTIVLIGVPSLLQMGSEQSFPRQLILLEASQTIIASLTQVVPKTQALQCDVLREPLPKLSAEVVVLDPPWYPEHIQSFLWAACQLCKVGGYILISIPPLGTRPGIEREWMEILDWAKQIGLTLHQLDKMALPYITPPFELNALKAEGLHSIPREWRRGNLAVFKRTHQSSVPRPTILSQEDKWLEVMLHGVRVRIRQSQRLGFADPSLVSVIPGDVLRSVSRRDKHRLLADLWTSGNRIFACQGRGVLLLILQALVEKRAPHQAVALALNRSLNRHETDLIFHATNQILDVINIEQKENLLFGEQHHYSKPSQRVS